MIETALCVVDKRLIDGIRIKKLGKRKSRRSNFFMGDMASAFDLALDERLTKLDYRLLLYLLGNMDYDNNVIVKQSYLAEVFSSQHSHISSSIKNLITLGIISKQKINGITAFHIEEHIAVRGQREYE